jgi:hypothetical protein
MGDLDYYFRIENDKHQFLHTLQSKWIRGFRASLLATLYTVLYRKYPQMQAHTRTVRLNSSPFYFCDVASGWSSHMRFSISGVDPTEHLPSMPTSVEKTFFFKNSRKLGEKLRSPKLWAGMMSPTLYPLMSRV